MLDCFPIFFCLLSLFGGLSCMGGDFALLLAVCFSCLLVGFFVFGVGVEYLCFLSQGLVAI